MLVHPFDDPRVMAGQGTVGLEVLEDAPDVDVVVVPVGGGGLVSGIAAAVAPRGVRVVGVEPEGSAALRLGARRRGAGHRSRPRRSPAGSMPRTSARTCSPPARRTASRPLTVTDDEIAEAMRRVYADAKLACEPAGAAAVAAVLAGRVSGSAVVAVVSGRQRRARDRL